MTTTYSASRNSVIAKYTWSSYLVMVQTPGSSCSNDTRFSSMIATTQINQPAQIAVAFTRIGYFAVMAKDWTTLIKVFLRR